MIAQLKINKDTLTPNNSLAKTDEIPIIDIGAMLDGEKNSINLVAEQINQACKWTNL